NAIVPMIALRKKGSAPARSTFCGMRRRKRKVRKSRRRFRSQRDCGLNKIQSSAVIRLWLKAAMGDGASIPVVAFAFSASKLGDYQFMDGPLELSLFSQPINFLVFPSRA